MPTPPNTPDFDQGLCGTCVRPAHASRENEGYSDCCNDRIEYGDEARASWNDEQAYQRREVA
jgi:hypothetical protein